MKFLELNNSIDYNLYTLFSSSGSITPFLSPAFNHERKRERERRGVKNTKRIKTLNFEIYLITIL